MKTLSFSRLFVYLGWLCAGFSLLILVKLKLLDNPIFFSLGFFYILFLPGFLISRLLKFENFSLSGQFLLDFVLGLSFYFIVNLLGILSGFSLQVLTPLVIVLLILLFITSFLYDWFKGNFKINLKIEYRLNSADWLYLLVVIVALLILWMVYLTGPGLNGDPYYHLTIIRKALEGNSLSVRSLSFTKTLAINPTYAYPVWQIFLAFLSRLFNLDIFSVWHNIIFVLTIISFFVWYYLARVIFQKKFLTILALLLWMILTFYDGAGYLFTRLSVPDTLAQLILLPLGIGLTLQYIFAKDLSKSLEWRLLIVNFLIALILLVIHGPHYFYLIISVLAFGLFYAIFYFKNNDYKLIMLRFLKVLLAEFLVLILVGIAMELRSQTISTALLRFNKAVQESVLKTNFFKFGLVYKYGFFLLPLVIIWRRTRWWIFFVAMLTIPLIYWTPLKDIFNELLTNVFINRLLGNMSWYFFVFAAISGIFLYLVDLFVERWSKNVRVIINVLISLVFLGALILEIKNQTVSDFIYKILYDKSTNAFVNTHYFWFFAIPLFLAAILLILRFIWPQRGPLRGEKNCLLSLSKEPKNHLTMFLLVSFISFALISPSIVNIRYYLKQPKNLQGESFFMASINHDRSALNYLKTQIPQKSVILASGSATKGIPTLANQYMAYNAGSAYEKNFQWVFDKLNPDEGKAEIVTSPKWAIDYIYLENPAIENSHFRLHPELYKVVYKNNNTEIYKVIK